MKPLYFVSILFGIFLGGTSSTWAAGLQVGFAEVDVTPKITKDRPVYIAGFGHDRKATGVHDPIMARVLILADGQKKIALVSVDVVGLFFPFVESVRKQCPKIDYVLISSTHNHEGPDTLGLWGATPFQSGIDPKYMEQLEKSIVQAIQDAEKTLASVTSKIGLAKAPELLHDGREPYIKHEDLVAIQFDDATLKKPSCLMVQWNCHPETMDSKNTLLTADYVHYTVETLKKQHGCPVIYFTGTVGGLMTSLHVPIKDDKNKEWNDGTWEKTELYGKKVAEVTNKALQQAKPVTLTPLEVRSQTLLLPMQNKLYQVGWQMGVLKRTAYLWKEDPTESNPVEAKDLSKPLAVKTEIGYLKLGEAEIAVIPGEIYPELVLGSIQDPTDKGADFPDAPKEPAIYDGLKAKYRLLIGLGNDEIGYILPKRQWDEKEPFCYGRKKSQYGEVNSIGPEAGPILCGQFRKLVEPKK